MEWGAAGLVNECSEYGVVGNIGVGGVAQEQLHSYLIALEAGQVQRSIAIALLDVGVGLALQQELDDSVQPVVSGLMQGSLAQLRPWVFAAYIVPDVRVRLVLQQQLCSVLKPTQRHPVQRCPSQLFLWLILLPCRRER